MIPRFKTVPDAGANWTAMMQVIEKWTERHTVSECMSALDRAGVPCAVYRDPGAALTDPHLLQRGAFATIADGAGEFVGVNAPWKMSGARTAMQREVPAIGAHRDEVLSRVLGLSSEAIADLAEAGAFGSPRDQATMLRRNPTAVKAPKPLTTLRAGGWSSRCWS